MPTPSVLVLGLGNDILTDDAIGLRVAQEVRHRVADEPDILVQETTEMGLALLDFLVGPCQVIIVDSIQTGRVPPGTLHELNADSLRTFTGRTPHFLGVGETLALGRLLGLSMPDRVQIFAVEVEDPFTLGTELTPALRASVPAVVERVIEACRQLAARRAPSDSVVCADR